MITIEEGINLLNKEKVVAIPTETVYGLAASINSLPALENIFAVKQRPFFDPLIVHVTGKTMAQSLVTYWPVYANQLADAFWPGPLTMVLPKSSLVKDIITAGLDSVAIRVPKHPVALEIIRQVGPLAAPSANMFTRTSPTCAEHVEVEFKGAVPVINGGPCEVGIESTVLGLFEKQIKIYRPGLITKDQISKVVGTDILIEHASSPVAPGQIKHHYMPKRPLALASDLEQLPSELKDQEISIWKMDGSAELVARELYSQMRKLDGKQGLMVFLVDKKNYHDEKWAGIKNRVQKAATYNFLE